MADNALYGALGPRQSDEMIQQWYDGQSNALMSSHGPRSLYEKTVNGINALLGGDNRESMADARRYARLPEAFAFPAYAGYDLSKFGTEGILENRPDKTIAAGILGAATMAAPYAIRGMTRLPTFEAVRDASMAKSLNSGTQAAFPTWMPHPDSRNTYGVRSSWTGQDVKHGSFPADYTFEMMHPNYGNYVMRRAGTTNENVPDALDSRYMNELIAQHMRDGFKVVKP